jgi:predicted transcriptional regulator
VAKLNPVAVTSADLLRAIDEGGWVTRAELFESVGRNPKNCARDLAILETAGLITLDADKASPRPLVLTEEGKAQLAAIGRAERGGQARRPRDRCMVANIIANPANRRVEDSAVAAMADTIEAVGDVLESVQLTPADANGVRMLLDGEHRWRAVQLLAEQGRLPEALEKGLRFEEREATEAEQILIRIVTATARADLSPLDDARQLLALQQATNWSAREIAKKTGRSPADSDTGVRDVQVKIRIAKEATPFFLAQYELDGSWDRLRDSVTEKKPAAEAPVEPEPAIALPTEEPVADAAASGLTVDLDHDWILGNADWRAEPSTTINSKGDSVTLRVFSRIGDVPGWFVSVSTTLSGNGFGESYRTDARNPIYSNRVEALQAARRRLLDRHPLAAPWVRNWLDQQMGPHFVNGRDCLNPSNAGEARRAAGLEARKANSGGGNPGAAAPAPPAIDAQGASLSDRADRMGVAAINGREFVLIAAIAELAKAIDGHLAGIRRDLVKGGQDLAQFDEDTESLRDVVANAVAAIEGLGLGEGDGLAPADIRRDLVKGGQDLAQFDEDTESLRDVFANAVAAIEGLGLGEGDGLAPAEDRAKPPALGKPFVPVRKSITPEHVTCLYDGRRFAGGLRQHLLTRHNETPDQYREKWKLPADYPMVAPNHAKRQHDALREAALRSVGQ